MSDFSKYMVREANKTQLVLSEFLDQWLKQNDTIELNFRAYLSAFKPYLLTGGKWGRPLLTRLGYQLSGKEIDRTIYKASAAVEIFHRYILCHDDIIDQDFYRHGIPTLEKIFTDELEKLHITRPVPTYGLGMAMIAGDLIHTLAMTLVIQSGLPQTYIPPLIRGFGQCLTETAAGWRLETILKQRFIREVSMTEVKKAMHLVSADYSFVWPLRLGQLMAGKTMGEWLQPLEDYSYFVGMAFQIQDDILGIFGDAKKTGKPVGNDLREGKKSLILLKGYQSSTREEKKVLEEVRGTEITEELVHAVRNILQKYGAVEWGQKLARSYIAKGVTALHDLDVKTQDTEALTRLQELAYFLAEREA